MSWAPFNSVISGSKMIKELERERNKVPKPILSEDQLNKINNILLEAYQNKVLILIKYYKNGYIFIIKGSIIKINSLKQEVIINKKRIFWSQIILVKIIDIGEV